MCVCVVCVSEYGCVHMGLFVCACVCGFEEFMENGVDGVEDWKASVQR